jgi:hypothetical protein
LKALKEVLTPLRYSFAQLKQSGDYRETDGSCTLTKPFGKDVLTTIGRRPTEDATAADELGLRLTDLPSRLLVFHGLLRF